jgi:phosphatidylglycerophosphatase A
VALTTSDRVATQLATWFGCGYVPLAPGTAGAVGALPLHYVLRGRTPVVHAGAIVTITAVGIWAGNVVARIREQDDPQCVVIDEVAGTLIAMGMVRRRGPLAATVAFGLFRLLDSTKPWPIHRLEHAKPPGLGIMLDDLLAGVMAGAITRALFRTSGHARQR